MTDRKYSMTDLLMALISKTNELHSSVVKNTNIIASKELDRLHKKILEEQPGNPAGYGWKSYSQNDEDGIIRYCLEKIATAETLTKTFVEIGVGAGYENNSYQLILDGFSGCWIDGNKSFINNTRSLIPAKQDRLLVHEEFITLENIHKTLARCLNFLKNKNTDFFSLDVDGNDYYFLPICIEILKPKLVCVEYNGKFPPPTCLYMKYNPTYVWDRSDYQGASLQALVDAIPTHTLVACSVVGINAFFVRNDLASVFPSYTTENLFQPARMHLLAPTQGHRPSHSWLRQSLENN